MSLRDFTAFWGFKGSIILGSKPARKASSDAPSAPIPLTLSAYTLLLCVPLLALYTPITREMGGIKMNGERAEKSGITVFSWRYESTKPRLGQPTTRQG